MNYTTHGILQAKILEWVAFPFSRGSSQPRNRTQVSCVAGRFFTNWAIREAPLCSDSCPFGQWPSNHLILCLLFLLLPSVFPSIQIFSSESAFRIRWPKYWSFGFSNSPSSEYSGLISFKINWFALLAVLQHHSSKASILQCSVFFMVQLSHPYMTTGKTIALTRQTFVGRCLCFLILCLGLA